MFMNATFIYTRNFVANNKILVVGGCCVQLVICDHYLHNIQGFCQFLQFF